MNNNLEKYAKFIQVILTIVAVGQTMYSLALYTSIPRQWIVTISDLTALGVYYLMDWAFGKILKKES